MGSISSSAIGSAGIVALMAALSGCLGTVRGDEPASSSPVRHGEMNAMSDRCVAQVPEGYEPLAPDDIRALFAPAWVEIEYLDQQITSNHRERFDARGIYGLLGGRAPYHGRYRLEGSLLITFIDDGPSAHRHRSRMLLRRRGGDQIYVHECGVSGSISAVRFKAGGEEDVAS